MKINKIFMLCSGLLLSGALLTSCSDDDNSYDFEGNSNNLAYFPVNATTPTANTITATPAGSIGVAGKMEVNFQRPVNTNTMVAVVANEAAAEKYNLEHQTNYPILPADVIDYAYAKTTVEAGEKTSKNPIQVRVASDKLAMLTEPTYLAAFTISDVLGDGVSSKSRNTFYTLVSVNANAQDKLHLVSNDVKNCSVVNTPIGRIGGISFEQAFVFDGALNNAATITLTKDNSLIAAYNAANNTDAVAMPDGVLDIENAQITIENGASESVEKFKMAVPEDKLGQLADGKYVVPFKISVQKEDGTTVADAGVFYLSANVITASGLINDYATEIPGSAISGGEGITCLAAENLDPASYASFFTTSSWSGWGFLQKQATASATFDLGETKTITAFNIGGSITDAFVEISEDNVNWTALGKQSEHTAVTKKEGWSSYSAYVLYAPMPARYLRVTLDVDENDYSWAYISWGWGPTTNGAIYVQ